MQEILLLPLYWVIFCAFHPVLDKKLQCLCTSLGAIVPSEPAWWLTLSKWVCCAEYRIYILFNRSCSAEFFGLRGQIIWAFISSKTQSQKAASWSANTLLIVDIVKALKNDLNNMEGKGLLYQHCINVGPFTVLYLCWVQEPLKFKHISKKIEMGNLQFLKQEYSLCFKNYMLPLCMHWRPKYLQDDWIHISTLPLGGAVCGCGVLGAGRFGEDSLGTATYCKNSTKNTPSWIYNTIVPHMLWYGMIDLLPLCQICWNFFSICTLTY